VRRGVGKKGARARPTETSTVSTTMMLQMVAASDDDGSFANRNSAFNGRRRLLTSGAPSAVTVGSSVSAIGASPDPAVRACD
jgi:hypothetical protein